MGVRPAALKAELNQFWSGGVEKGGITAYPGDYGYEPNGVIHDHTEFPEQSVLYFTNNGPIRFIEFTDGTSFSCSLTFQPIGKAALFQGGAGSPQVIQEYDF